MWLVKCYFKNNNCPDNAVYALRRAASIPLQESKTIELLDSPLFEPHAVADQQGKTGVWWFCNEYDFAREVMLSLQTEVPEAGLWLQCSMREATEQEVHAVKAEGWYCGPPDPPPRPVNRSRVEV